MEKELRVLCLDDRHSLSIGFLKVYPHSDKDHTYSNKITPLHNVPAFGDYFLSNTTETFIISEVYLTNVATI